MFKTARLKHLLHILLQEINRNVPAVYVRQWNILGAGHNVARTWESIMPAVIQNGFTQCGFGTLSAVSAEGNEEDNKWDEVQDHMDFPGSCNRFFNVDQLIPTTDNKKDEF
jgi:hypothetical protein